MRHLLHMFRATSRYNENRTVLPGKDILSPQKDSVLPPSCSLPLENPMISLLGDLGAIDLGTRSPEALRPA